MMPVCIKPMHWGQLGRVILLACLMIGLFAGAPANHVAAQSQTPWVPTQVAELTAVNCCGEIGAAVSLSGTTAVVAAPNAYSKKGAVYIYEQDAATGKWPGTPSKTLRPQSGDSLFGISVNLDGDTLVVGGMSGSARSNQAPYAYVFGHNVGGSGNWGLVQILRPAPGQARGEWLYTKVAVSGDTLAISTPYQDVVQKGYDPGSVDLYQRDAGGTWNFLTRLTSTADDDLFGVSLALQGDTLVAGAVQCDDCTLNGKAYVFSRNQGGADHWGVQTTLRPSQSVSGEFYGYSVALDGSQIVVGAPGLDEETAESGWGKHNQLATVSGAAYVYQLTGGSWQESARLTNSAGDSSDNFGIAVAAAGGMVAVGASNASLPLSGQGAAYLYTQVNGVLSPYHTLLINDPKPGDGFGFSLDMQDGTLIGGAPWHVSSQCQNCDGAGYIFQVKEGSGGGDGGGNGGGNSQAPAIDLNGAAAGSDYSASYTTPQSNTPFPWVPIVDPSGLILTAGSQPTLVNATVTITNLLDTGNELLAATDSGTVHAVYDASSGKLVLTSSTPGNTGTLEDFQTVLRSVRYQNKSWQPDTTPRKVTFVVNDGSLDSNTATTTIAINSAQQVPMLVFYIDGQQPFHVNQDYPVYISVMRPGGAGPELGVPTGSVTVQVGTNGPTCTSALDASGQGTCSISIIQGGNFNITVTYSGDANYASTTASLGYAFDYYRMWVPQAAVMAGSVAAYNSLTDRNDRNLPLSVYLH